MGLFTRTAVAPAPVAAVETPEVRATGPLGAANSLMRLLQSASAGVSVTELAALKVPAFSRGMSLITGTCAKLPLTQFEGKNEVPGSMLLAQPEPDQIPWVTYQRTFQDVGLHAKAYWLIVDVDADGYPTRVQQLPATDVDEVDSRPGFVQWNGKEFPLSVPSLAEIERQTNRFHSLGRVIKFESYQVGILDRGRDCLQTAIYLEQTAAGFAQKPLPNMALRNTGVDLVDTQRDDLLDEWETAREAGTTAFLQGPIEIEKYGWSASELQLVDARNQAAVQISRLLNLDPFHVGASLEGTSLTYGNRVDIRSDLIDFTLSDYLTPVQERLSMRDITRPGLVSRFDTTDFTRANLAARVDMVATLLPLNVITPDEAREILTYAPLVKGMFA